MKAGDSGGAFRCQTNMAHLRQSTPDSGPGFQVEALRTIRAAPSWPRSWCKTSSILLALQRASTRSAHSAPRCGQRASSLLTLQIDLKGGVSEAVGRGVANLGGD